jgi:hypothetical protein
MIRALEDLLGLAWYTFKVFMTATVVIWISIIVIGSMLSTSAEAGLFKAYDEENPPVKMSNSEICHAEDSSYYSRTKNFTIFGTLEDCIEAGGRLPKNYTPKEENV